MAEIEMNGAKVPTDIENKQAQTYKTMQEAEYQQTKLPSDLANMNAQTQKTMVDALMAQQAPQEWDRL